MLQSYFFYATPICRDVTLAILFLTASAPARFVKTLSNISIPMSQKLRLECTFNGAQKLFVTWFKDGRQLYASYRFNTKVTDNSCILECLHECDKNTTGKYSCEVSNAFGRDICHANVTAVTGLYTMDFSNALQIYYYYVINFGLLNLNKRYQ